MHCTLAFFFKNDFRWRKLIFKSSLNLFLQHCFHFTFCSFGHEACGILVPQPGIKAASSALEDEVLTAGQSGKSLNTCILLNIYSCLSCQQDPNFVDWSKYLLIFSLAISCGFETIIKEREKVWRRKKQKICNYVWWQMLTRIIAVIIL